MTAESERAAIVAWLRETADGISRGVTKMDTARVSALGVVTLLFSADRIERGEHIKELGND